MNLNFFSKCVFRTQNDYKSPLFEEEKLLHLYLVCVHVQLLYLFFSSKLFTLIIIKIQNNNDKY